MESFNRFSDIDQYRRRIERAAAQINRSLTTVPEFLLILGSGLGSLANQVEDAVVLAYSAIDGFPQATSPGHEGELILGWWQDRQVAVMKGRFHVYEGHSTADLVLPIRVMQKLGVPGLVLTNAAGGMDSAFTPGDLMLIRDHIGLWADSPLKGLNLDEFGPRFPDQTTVYDREWGDLALSCARELGITLHEGIYAYCSGPQYETPAEIRLLRMLGATAVGMSTVQEAIVAAHGGMRTLAISCITNFAAGIQGKPLSHQDVLTVGAQTENKIVQLLSRIFARMPDLRE